MTDLTEVTSSDHELDEIPHPQKSGSWYVQTRNTPTSSEFQDNTNTWMK